MPYRSLAQEHLFHSSNSPVSKAVVAEFDAATKGKHLPMHAAHGGMVCPTCGRAIDEEPELNEADFAEALRRTGRY